MWNDQKCAFVVVSTSLSDPTPLIPDVRAAVDALDPGVPVTIEPLGQIVSTELARHRLGLLLMGLFAVVSLLLAGIGIHGVVGHVTALRFTEFAVRIAVGARPEAIAGSILKQGGQLWLLGVVSSVGWGIDQMLFRGIASVSERHAKGHCRAATL